MTGATALLGIIELGSVCARQRAINLDLFEQLGALVTAGGISRGDEQQLAATACHRHAWHAELWAQRAPSIPPVQFGGAFDRTVDRYRGSLAVVAKSSDYRAAAGVLRGELTELLGRVDPLLDPSTTRTINLVLGDL